MARAEGGRRRAVVYNVMTMSTQEGAELAMKLELLATVAQATVAAILHVVDERRSGLLTPQEEEKVSNLRTHIEAAVEAVEDYMDRVGDEAIDLHGLRDKLVSIVQTLDAHTVDPDVLPS